MLSDLVWHDIEDAFVYGGESEFDFAHNGKGLHSLEWMQFDSRGRPFVIGLRYKHDKVVFSWGWECSTLHDAVVWDSLPEGCTPALIESIRRHIRRVAGFGVYELKRPLEFAELAGAFTRVVNGWQAYIAAPGISQLLDGRPVHTLLDGTTAPQEYMLQQGKITTKLQRRGGLWVVEITTEFGGPEIWYFCEEANPSIDGREYVHSSNLAEELSRTLCGV